MLLKSNGFTLIQLIVVLVIIGVASAITGITLYKSIEDLNLKTFTKELSSSMRFARSQAAARGKTYSFIIDHAQRNYSLYAADDRGSLNVKDMEQLASKQFPENINIIGSDYTRIDFFPQGDSTAGEIEIKNQKGLMFQIIVERISGNVKVKKVK